MATTTALLFGRRTWQGMTAAWPERAPAPPTRFLTLVCRRRASSRATPIRGLAPLVALLALWQVFGDAQSTNYPPPSTWWTAVHDRATQGDLYPAIRRTLAAFLLVLVIATVLGTLLGDARRARARGRPGARAGLRVLPDVTGGGGPARLPAGARLHDEHEGSRRRSRSS